MNARMITSRCSGCPWWLGVLAAAAVFPLIAGCGKSGPPMVRVEGRVTFHGAAPLKPGKITFAPIESAEGLPKHHGTADFDTNGDFVVTTFNKGDGLIPGKYRVDIKCWKKNPTPATMISDNYVPRSYRPPELVIDQAGTGPVRADYDVPSK